MRCEYLKRPAAIMSYKFRLISSPFWKFPSRPAHFLFVGTPSIEEFKSELLLEKWNSILWSSLWWNRASNRKDSSIYFKTQEFGIPLKKSSQRGIISFVLLKKSSQRGITKRWKRKFLNWISWSVTYSISCFCKWTKCKSKRANAFNFKDKVCSIFRGKIIYKKKKTEISVVFMNKFLWAQILKTVFLIILNNDIVYTLKYFQPIFRVFNYFLEYSKKIYLKTLKFIIKKSWLFS